MENFFCRTLSPAAGAIGVRLAGSCDADAGRLRRLVVPLLGNPENGVGCHDMPEVVQGYALGRE